MSDAVDIYAGRSASDTVSADDAWPITASDSADLAHVTRALRCAYSGTAGIVRVMTRAGQVRDIPISPGEQWDVRVSRVYATGTTAAGLWGLR